MKRLRLVLFGCVAWPILATLTACPGPAATPKPARAQVRGAVLTLADAVEAADSLCADVVLSLKVIGKPYLPLAYACIDGYKMARAGLIDAEAALDVLDELGSSDAALGKIGCASAATLGGLETTIGALRRAGVAIPARVDDAVSMGHWIGEMVGGQCAYRGAYESDAGPDAAEGGSDG